MDVRWVTLHELSDILGDKKTTSIQYELFIKLIERLYKNEKSYMFMDFISQFMVPMVYENQEMDSAYVYF